MYSDMLMKKRNLTYTIHGEGGIGHGDTEGTSRRDGISCVF